MTIGIRGAVVPPWTGYDDIRFRERPDGPLRASLLGSRRLHRRLRPGGAAGAAPGRSACRPNSRTSPRSSTANCGWNASCSSACGRPGRSTDAENSLAELARLAETAGSQVLDGLIQRRDRPDPATYIGSGKAKELRDIVTAEGADTVICDGELTPGQLRQLEEVVKVKVVDRTALILDIFAQHAQSKEGKAQVELAQLQYLLPRLRGWGESLSRQVGGRAAGGLGIGGRGPGETKIEIDRRRINTRMAKLRKEIAGMKTSRDVKRARRVAPAGAQRRARRLHERGQVLAAEPAHRCRACSSRTRCSRRSIRLCAGARPADGRPYTLADTVGFVRHLPTQLVEAFRSTLEEVADADLILHVVDAADADPAGPDPRGARGARPRSTHWRARAARLQQGRRRRPRDAASAAAAGTGRAVRLGATGAGLAELSAVIGAAAAAPGHRGQRAAALHPRRPRGADP